MKTQPFYEDTVVILFGDHEGIHKYHETNFEENNGLLPFLIFTPGIGPLEIESIGGQVDMLPTLLYLMGADPDVYEDKVMGKNLLTTNEGYVLLANGEFLGSPTDPLHLTDALNISDLIFSTDYFSKEKLRQNKYTQNSSMPKDNTAVKSSGF
jgi:phosphoglycerol transferase MdoB-like AlkP superfamily enzyme